MSTHPSREEAVDYLAGDRPEEDAARFEDHLFECDECSRVVDELRTTTEGLRAVVAAGKVAMAAPPALLERLEKDGVRVRHHRPGPPGPVPCWVSADDDYVASHLPGDFTGLESVDVVTIRADGVEMRRVRGVPVAPGDREVTMLTTGDVVRTFPSMTFRYVLLAGERVVAEYVFEHKARG
ncbi:MAG: anti-sigma factor family protein [Polyangiaceae bacterium]